MATAAHGQQTPLDYRGAALGMSVEGVVAVVSERQTLAGARPYIRCHVVDYRHPEPTHTECQDDNENVVYAFFSDEAGVERLWRILAIGTIDDYLPFVEGLDRRFAESAQRRVVREGVSWTRGRYSVVARRVCGEAFRSVASYRGVCALYVDTDAQARFNAGARALQRRDF